MSDRACCFSFVPAVLVLPNVVGCFAGRLIVNPNAVPRSCHGRSISVERDHAVVVAAVVCPAAGVLRYATIAIDREATIVALHPLPHADRPIGRPTRRSTAVSGTNNAAVSAASVITRLAGRRVVSPDAVRGARHGRHISIQVDRAAIVPSVICATTGHLGNGSVRVDRELSIVALNPVPRPNGPVRRTR